MKGQPSSQNFFNSKTIRDAIDKATSPLQKIIDEANPIEFEALKNNPVDLSDMRVEEPYQIEPIEAKLHVDEFIELTKQQNDYFKAQLNKFDKYVSDAKKEAWFSRKVSIASIAIALASLFVAIFK